MLVDQAGDFYKLTHRIDFILSKGSWCSLLEDEPEGYNVDECPLLIQINLKNKECLRWLAGIVNEYPEFERYLLFFSDHAFSVVATVLKTLIVSEWGGRKGIFRFYDARLFPKLITQILSCEQIHAFRYIATLWSWCDRNGNPEYYDLKVMDDSAALDIRTIELTDEQVEEMGFVSDIESVMSRGLNKETYDLEAMFEYLWCEAHKCQSAVIDFNKILEDKGVVFFKKC